MRVATDIGGTFTDLAYVGTDGTLQVDKSSSTPGEFEVGVGYVLDHQFRRELGLGRAEASEGSVGRRVGGGGTGSNADVGT